MKTFEFLLIEDGDFDQDINPLTPFTVDYDRFIAVESSEDIIHSFSALPAFVTVINVEETHTITVDWLQKKISQYRATDDVFHQAFLKGVIFSCHGFQDVDIISGARNYLKSLGTIWVGVTRDEDNLKSGPYASVDHRLLEIWKLYDDTYGAFLHTLISGPYGDPSELRVGGEYIQSRSVAVPSRLRTEPSHEKPLSGLRVAVKDIFHIKGVRMSVCNKAWYDLYPPPTTTAACIQLLHHAGATVLGTTKLASFAATEEPIECIDFPAPWNPRADGHQSPAGSSSGSGVAAAAYDWLDITIGSDTSGSGRRPGHWNGCFAMRPTHDCLPTEGYIPSFPRFDVPTFFGRDLSKCRNFAFEWYGKSLKQQGNTRPDAIIYPTDYISMIKNKDQVAIIDQFIADLETSLGIKHEKISFEELWNKAPPSRADDQNFQDYMKDVCLNSFFHDDYHSFDQFRADYKQKFSKEPYVSPPVRWQWELSSKITEEERNEAVTRLDAYRDWFYEKAMRMGEQNAVVIIPIEEMSPRYRDEATSRFKPVGVPNLFLSPILGAPELTVPVGEYKYTSKVTSQVEKLPIAISILACAGHDMMLFDIVHECLSKSSRPTSVLAGKEMFPS